MPCNSDYLDPDNRERELSRVACLLDEIAGKQPIDRDHWRGFHPLVYNKNPDGDAMVVKLCAALQSCDVAKFSLEMQIWWRDHQAADKERIVRDLKKAQTNAERDAALEKLTQHERSLLGV